MVLAVSFIFLGMATTIEATACGNKAKKCSTTNTDKASKTEKSEREAEVTTEFLTNGISPVPVDKCGEGKCAEGKCAGSKKSKEEKEGEKGEEKEEGETEKSEKGEKSEEGQKGEHKCGEGKCG